MREGNITHIPLANGLACGSRSLTAVVNTDNQLCRKCFNSLRSKLRQAIREHVKDNGLVTDPEGLINRFLGQEAEEDQV